MLRIMMVLAAAILAQTVVGCRAPSKRPAPANRPATSATTTAAAPANQVITEEEERAILARDARDFYYQLISRTTYRPGTAATDSTVTEATTQALTEEVLASKTGDWEDAFKELERRRATDVFVQALRQDRDSYLVMASAAVLGRLKDPAVIPSLVNALRFYNTEPSAGDEEQQGWYRDIKVTILNSLEGLTGQEFHVRDIDDPAQIDKAIAATERWMKAHPVGTQPARAK